MLVSHDRWFLESVATGVLELDRGRSKLWPMRYSTFRRERALAIDRQGAEAARQAAEIARLERFVTRWSAGTKARQASSRQKRLDKIQRVEAPTRAAHLAFGFPKSERSGRVVVEVDGLTVKVPGRTLLTDVGFTLERGQRLAVIGPNGTGKTTLMETLIGRRPAAAGRVSIGHKVVPAYFPARGGDAQRPAPSSRPSSPRATSPRPRRARCSAASCSRARPPRPGWSACRAASGAAWSWWR